MSAHKYIGMEIGKTSNLLKRNFSSNKVKQQIEEATGKNSWIIAFLAEHQDEDVFQKDIERIFSIRRSTVSNILKLMEKKGYINREPVEYDARLKRLVLTKQAMDMYNLLMEQLNEKELILRKNISDEELETFFSILLKIQNNIK